MFKDPILSACSTFDGKKEKSIRCHYEVSAKVLRLKSCDQMG